MYFPLPGIPVSSASRLSGVNLLLVAKLGQGQQNYQLAHEELRGMSFTVLKDR